MKTVIVIGGSGLIGSSIIEKFIKHYRVVNLDREKILVKNKNYFFENFDITKHSSLEKKIKKIFNKYSDILSVINCSYPHAKNCKKCNFDEIKYKDLNNNLVSHLHSFIWSSCIFLKVMKEKKKKSNLILLSSIYGLRGQDMSIYHKTKLRENLAYVVSKGGINSFVKGAASFYGKYNIRVNAISPGGVKTNKNQKIQTTQDSIFLKNYKKRVPLKRLAQSADIANAAFFLSSNEADYITGINLMVDGGWTSI
jgi:NAD(P)-dependent dehydrogenase (short-subunit alcohol dehydrogenase family)